jgi:hypothetical protein
MTMSSLWPAIAVGMPLVGPVEVSIVYALMVLAPVPETTYRKLPVWSMTEEWGPTSAVNTGDPVAGFMGSRLPSVLILQPDTNEESWFET